MKKPSKILGIRINYVPKADMDDSWGEYSEKGVIRIGSDLSDDETKLTLAHELMHYAFHKSGMNSQLHYLSNNTVALEEGIVSAIEQQLVAPGVLILNPKFFKKGKS